jgi:hypothetical protein
MAAELKLLRVRDRRQWRGWLGKHHTSSPGVWFVFYKLTQACGRFPMRILFARRCASDSLVKRLDDDRYVFEGHATKAHEQVVSHESKTVGGRQGGRPAHLRRARGRSHQQHLRAPAGRA